MFFIALYFFTPKQVVFLVYISIIFHRTRKKKALFFSTLRIRFSEPVFIISLTVPYHRQYVLIVIACLDDLGFYRTKSSVPSPLPSAFPLLYLVALADKKKKGAGFFFNLSIMILEDKKGMGWGDDSR